MTTQKRIGFLMILLAPIGAYVAHFSWKGALFATSIHLMLFGVILFVGTKE